MHNFRNHYRLLYNYFPDVETISPLLKVIVCALPAPLPYRQFLKLWTGAGILPLRFTNSSQENEFTGMIGA